MAGRVIAGVISPGGTRSRSQGWPQATRQGVALTAARTPPYFGMAERGTATHPRLTAGVCLIHLSRNSFRFASKKDWDGLSRDLKPIYTAVDAEAAAAALDGPHAKWGTRYPAITRPWHNAWQEFIPFLDYDVETIGSRIAHGRSGLPGL
jgi:hypothetical protein